MGTVRRVFIFAHCDDELFCLPLLLQKNSSNTIIFLTTTDMRLSATKVNDVRRLEATKVCNYLSKFQDTRVIFFEREVFDGTIHLDFDRSRFDQLSQLVSSLEADELVSLCFEGGHQDHDSVEVITQIIAKNLNLKLSSYSGYRASKMSSKFFSVMKPHSPLPHRIEFNRLSTVIVALRLMFIYKSQAKSWVGLGPPLLLKYTFFRFREGKRRSTIGPEIIFDCFYENRNRATQEKVFSELNRLKEKFVEET
jgi:LmbE family N-acetylglucosaminyl deacetylase